MINQARKKMDPKGVKALKVNNPYIGMSFENLLDCLSSDNYRAPAKPSFEWDQFMWALMNAPRNGSKDLK